MKREIYYHIVVTCDIRVRVDVSHRSCSITPVIFNSYKHLIGF
jgi:hypothetical protein